MKSTISCLTYATIIFSKNDNNKINPRVQVAGLYAICLLQNINLVGILAACQTMTHCPVYVSKAI